MRLQKRGRRRDYHSRIVVMEASQGTHSGKYVDMLGSYDHKQGTVQLDKEKAADWLSKGVQPSVTVHNILVSEGVMKADKKNALPKKTSPVVEAPAEEEAAPAEPAAEEAPAEETPTEEAPAEEAPEEAPAEEVAAEEAPAEEAEAPAETEEEKPAEE